MTQVLVIVLALLIGVIAGLRAMTAPAVVAWGAFLGWIDVDGKWSEWVAHPITVTVLTIFLLVELVTDQLPKTPSRKTAPQFATRLIMGAFAGAVIGSAFFHTFSAIGRRRHRCGARHDGRCRGQAAAVRRPTTARTGRAHSSKTWSRSAADSWSPSWSASSDTRPMAEKFDAIIVGAGQAGPPLAGRLTEAGQTVAVIERKLVGGTCVNYGCIPTKTLVASAHAAHLARRGAEYGIGTGEISVDMAKVKARKDKIMLDDREGVESWLEGMNGLHLHPRPRPLRRPAHHPGGRPGARGRQDLPQCRRPGRGARHARALRHRLPDECRHPRTRHRARASGDHRRQLHRAGVRADVPPIRRPRDGDREGPAADVPRGRGRLGHDQGDPGGRGHRRGRRRQ